VPNNPEKPILIRDFCLVKVIMADGFAGKALCGIIKKKP